MGDRYVTLGKPDDREPYSPREFGDRSPPFRVLALYGGQLIVQ
jgi:hypothetical protein